MTQPIFECVLLESLPTPHVWIPNSIQLLKGNVETLCCVHSILQILHKFLDVSSVKVVERSCRYPMHSQRPHLLSFHPLIQILSTATSITALWGVLVSFTRRTCCTCCLLSDSRVRRTPTYLIVDKDTSLVGR